MFPGYSDAYTAYACNSDDLVNDSSEFSCGIFAEELSLPLAPKTNDAASMESTTPAAEPPKKKRRRNVFQQHQLKELEDAFRACAKPTDSARQELSERIGLTTKQVKIWFQNRRYKIKTMEKSRRQKPAREEDDLPTLTPESMKAAAPPAFVSGPYMANVSQSCVADVIPLEHQPYLCPTLQHLMYNMHTYMDVQTMCPSTAFIPLPANFDGIPSDIGSQGFYSANAVPQPHPFYTGLNYSMESSGAPILSEQFAPANFNDVVYATSQFPQATLY